MNNVHTAVECSNHTLRRTSPGYGKLGSSPLNYIYVVARYLEPMNNHVTLEKCAVSLLTGHVLAEKRERDLCLHTFDQREIEFRGRKL